MSKETETNKHVRLIQLDFDSVSIPDSKPVRKNNKDYVLYGKKNNFPEFLSSITSQAEHSAIVNGKVDFIALEGFNLEKLNNEQRDWFTKYDLNDIVHKITYDLETYGGFALKIVRSRDGESIGSIEYQDFEKIRVSAEDENVLYVGDDWEKYRTDVEEYPRFDVESNEPESIFYYTGNSKDVYPEPGYKGALKAIQTGIEIDNFHLRHVQNGFFIPTVINFNNGIPDEERQDEIERDVKNTFTGTDNAGDLLISFNEDKEKAVSIDTFEPAELDKKFEVLADQIQQKIFTSHRVTSPMLFGIKSEGQLGGRSELVDAWNLFNKNYILPKQNKIVSIFQELLELNWNEIDLELIPNPPIDDDYLAEEHVLKNMTRAEIREKAGFDDTDLSEHQKKIMTLHDLPDTVLTDFIQRLTDQQLFNLIGFDPDESEEIEDGENENIND